MIHSIIKDIRQELTNRSDSQTKKNFERFFKEEVVYYGVKSAELKKINQKYWPKIKSFQKSETFQIFEQLLSSDYCEEAFLVCAWAPKIKNQFEKADLLVFENWIDKYLNNWAKIDSFCNHTVGDFIEKFPETIEQIKNWGRSQNRWMKRASAVSLIIPAKHGKYLTDVFTIADQLLEDKDDMVQKGYGWLLKEASRHHQKEVFDYVVKNKAKMPRTALRYAIELMPRERKIEAMKH